MTRVSPAIRIFGVRKLNKGIVAKKKCTDQRILIRKSQQFPKPFFETKTKI